MSMSSYYRQLRERIGTELLLVPSVAAVVRNERGLILVQRTSSGSWSLPAGAIEPGEAPAQAVAREVREETGLCVRPTRLLGVIGGKNGRFTYPSGDRVEYVVSVFECERVFGELSADNDETSALEWFLPDRLPRLAFPYPNEVLTEFAPEAHFEWDEAWLEELR